MYTKMQWVCGEKDPHTLLMEMQINEVTVEISMKTPQWPGNITRVYVWNNVSLDTTEIPAHPYLL
jgi:hypothetical protein